MNNPMLKSKLSRILMITFLLALPVTLTTNLWAATRNVSTTLRHMTAEFSEFFLVSGMVC
jgi:hypothetical protein